MTENISAGTQTSPTAEYEPLKVDFTPTPAVVPLVAWTWNTPVIPQFYWNVYSAEQRIKQICLEIGRIQEYLNYFAAHYNKMCGYLNKRIDKLTAAMYAEVERIDKAIEEENKARKLADELLQKGLDAEIARAKATEIVLQQNIDTNTNLIEDEEKRAKDAEEKLTTDLHDETTARIAEDKKINDTVETNRQHAEEVDAQLFDSIHTEANIRKNADNLLNDRIDKETEERKANDASINTRIDNEHTERVKVDNALDKRVTDNQQAIEHEVERAKSAENNLNDALEREIDARVDTDRSLENTIDANDRASKERDNKLQGNIDANDTASKDRDKQLQANIDAEVTNRGNAENAIKDLLNNEIIDRTALSTRVDKEQTERIKTDNALDKRVTDNAQAIEHETERAKSAETNLNDALEREVDARQDDTRNLENQIDKFGTDSAKRDGVLQASIDVEAEKRATEDNKKVSVVNIKSASYSHITVKTANENTENATVTIGDTFSADFDKVNNDIEAEKQRAIAKENELSGKVEHETQERQSETNTLNAEVAKRPTLDKFIAGDNITLTPDVDKTTLTINANTSNKVSEDIEAEKQRAIAKENELSGKVEHETQERQTETTALNAEVAKRPTLDKFIAGNNITLTQDVGKTTLTINADASNKLLSGASLNREEFNHFVNAVATTMLGEGNISVVTRLQENKASHVILSVPKVKGLLYIKDTIDEELNKIVLTLDYIQLYKDIEEQYEHKHALYSPDNSIKILKGGNGKYNDLVLNKDVLPKIPTLVGKDGISVTEDKEHNLINITNVANITQLNVNADSRYKANERIFISFKELGLDSNYVINAFFAIKEGYWETAYIKSDNLEIPATSGGYKLDLRIYYTNVAIEKSLTLL